MAKPHHIPLNVKLTNNLTKGQSLGSDYPGEGCSAERNWSLNEGLNASAAALERMIANGWKGYPSKARKAARPSAPKCADPRPDLGEAEVRAWIFAHPGLARAIFAEHESVVNGYCIAAATLNAPRKTKPARIEPEQLITFA